MIEPSARSVAEAFVTKVAPDAGISDTLMVEMRVEDLIREARAAGLEEAARIIDIILAECARPEVQAQVADREVAALILQLMEKTLAFAAAQIRAKAMKEAGP